MRSMTGFGKGIAEKDNQKITIEIKSVNHKQLDLSIKTPRKLAFCDEIIRTVCKSNVKRGHVDVYCSFEDTREDKGEIAVDTALARQYLNAGNKLAELGIINDLTASSVLRLPDVISITETDVNEETIREIVKEATEIACANLVAMREREGANMRDDLSMRLANLEKIVDGIKLRAPLVAEDYAKKLKQRMLEVLQGVELDEGKFLNEVAFFVDKSNVDEELARLSSHLEYGKKLLASSGEIGKKLDFLVQEINREINTTGSKSNDLEMTEKVLLAKNELEKFREQVQNIE